MHFSHSQDVFIVLTIYPSHRCTRWAVCTTTRRFKFHCRRQYAFPRWMYKDICSSVVPFTFWPRSKPGCSPLQGPFSVHSSEIFGPSACDGRQEIPAPILDYRNSHSFGTFPSSGKHFATPIPPVVVSGGYPRGRARETLYARAECLSGGLSAETMNTAQNILYTRCEFLTPPGGGWFFPRSSEGLPQVFIYHIRGRELFSRAQHLLSFLASPVFFQPTWYVPKDAPLL